MRLPRALVCLVFALTCVIPARGQQQQGDVELQLQGSYSTTIGADLTSSLGSILGKVAPFLTENIQIGVGPIVSIATNEEVSQSGGQTVTTSETDVTFGTTFFVVYSLLLKDAKAVPYLGASFYKRDFSNSNEKGWVGVNGGMKYFFAKKAAFDVSANYLISLNPDTKGGLLLFAFGLSFLV